MRLRKLPEASGIRARLLAAADLAHGRTAPLASRGHRRHDLDREPAQHPHRRPRGPLCPLAWCRGVRGPDDLDPGDHVPVVEPEPRWYKTLDGGPGPSETWRDPLVIRDPDGDGWHMLICARGGGRAQRRRRGRPRPQRRPADLGARPAADRARRRLRAARGGPGLGRRRGALAGVHLSPPGADGRADRRRWWGVLHLVGRGESLLGPWDFTRAQPFRPEPDLFAAPLGPTGPTAGYCSGSATPTPRVCSRSTCWTRPRCVATVTHSCCADRSGHRVQHRRGQHRAARGTKRGTSCISA